MGLFGLLGSGNLGNDGSLDALVDQLRRLDIDVELGFFCMGADVVSARYGAPATYLQWYEPHAGRAVGWRAVGLKVLGKLLDPLRTLAWVRHHDVVIVPGMGVLEATVPVRPWALPYSLFWLAVTARASGAAVALVAVGADQVRSWATRQLVVTAARLAHYRSFRDELSRDAMAAMGVDVSRDLVHPDLVFSLRRPTPWRAGGLVAVGVMNYRGSNDDRARAAELHHRYLTAMTELVGRLLDTGRRVRLFSTDQEDEPVVAAVLSAVRAQRPGAPDVEHEPVATIHELMDALAGADLVVASRYHNVLCALMLSKPTVSVGYAAKHEALMRSYGMAGFSERAGTVDAGRLVALCAALESDRDHVVAALERRNAEISRSSAGQLRAVEELLLGALGPGAGAARAERPRQHAARPSLPRHREVDRTDRPWLVSRAS